MVRKQVAGNIRNKERSKEKFLEAVGIILETKGYPGLKVNDIAAIAGVDKKMIYSHFGGADELIDEYIRSQDFWSNVSGDVVPDFTDGGQEFSKHILKQQFDTVAQNKHLQKILLWGVAEQRPALKRVADDRELVGEQLFGHITDPYFGSNATEYRSAVAIIIAGIYYLNMYRGVNADTFCGIDITKKEGNDEIKKALDKLIDLVYQDHKNQAKE